MTDQAELIKRSKWIPNDWKVPKGKNVERTINKEKRRFFKYRYRLIEERRTKLDILARRYNDLMNDMNDFINKNEWFEAQMRQAKDICYVLGAHIDEEEDCPEELDHDEILFNRKMRTQDNLERHIQRFPGELKKDSVEYRWRQNYREFAAEANVAYIKYRSNRDAIYHPAEERHDPHMLDRKDCFLSSYIKETLVPTDIQEKRFLPELVRNRHNSWFRTSGNRDDGYAQREFGMFKTLVATPQLPPTLEKQDILIQAGSREPQVVNVIKEGHPDGVVVEE